MPSPDDAVIGTIVTRHSESYDVDIGAPFRATLSALAFEGAVRRNRPNLKVGDLVYCRVESTDRDVEPMLTCMDGSGRVSGGRSCEWAMRLVRLLCGKMHGRCCFLAAGGKP